MYITATELRNNIKKHLDHVAEGHTLVVTRGNESFTLARKDSHIAPSGTEETDSLLHTKVDAIIDAIERIEKSPRVSSAGIQGASPAVGVPNRPVGTFDPTKIPGVTKGFPQEETITGGDWGA